MDILEAFEYLIKNKHTILFSGGLEDRSYLAVDNRRECFITGIDTNDMIYGIEFEDIHRKWEIYNE